MKDSQRKNRKKEKQRYNWRTRIPLIGRLVRLVAEEYGRIYHGGRVAGVEECFALLREARQITLIHCACRKMQGACDRPLRTCIAINTAAEVFAHEEIKKTRVITAEEAREIISNSRSGGTVHFISYCINSHEYVICNCCACCCVPLTLRRDYGIYNAMQDGHNNAVIDTGKCTGCDDCSKVCPMQAIETKLQRVSSRCIGCGLCAEACRHQAITMLPRDALKRAGAVPGWLRSFLYVPLLLIIFPLVWMYIRFALKKPLNNG